ncbi:MAG: hypothetical protein WC304_03120 [Candidatus Gracilibacteria bacterium]|jgi:hypothetical protein
MEKAQAVSEAIDTSLVEAKRLFEVFEKFYLEFLTFTMNPPKESISEEDLVLVSLFRHHLASVKCGLMSDIENIDVYREDLNWVITDLRRLQIFQVLNTPAMVSRGYRYLEEFHHLENSKQDFNPAMLDLLINTVWNLLESPLGFKVDTVKDGDSCSFYPLPTKPVKTVEAE